MRALAPDIWLKGGFPVAIEQTKAYKTLRRSMLESLEAKGLVEDVYRDKVDEYMELWRQRMELREDIRDRGVAVMDIKRGMMVENRSVSLEIQVSKQMLAIFTALGFKPPEGRTGRNGWDDDEL